MNGKMRLREIERTAWTSYFEDGLWDLFFGVLFLISGIRSLTDNVWYVRGLYTLLLVACILILPIGKKRITIPRLGHVKFGRARKLRQSKAIAILAISVLTTFALLMLPKSGLAPPPKMPISPIIAAWIAVVFGVLAYYLDFKRLFAYGVLFAISEVLSGLFGEPIGSIMQAILGVAVLVVGIAVFMRFMRRYPLPTEETPNVQG
jgi:hypothetical protein